MFDRAGTVSQASVGSQGNASSATYLDHDTVSYAHRQQPVAAKRVFDLVVGSVLIVLLAPVMLIVGAAIRIDTPGPIFFSQRRPGYRGEKFLIFKFRTMRSDAESLLESDPELYAQFVANGCKFPDGADRRVSRVGRFLRKSSLDELPQLINVLRGEMSLVGPRPVVGPEFDGCQHLVPIIHRMKPGMTGLWQVSGRSAVSGVERARLDVEYVSRWSLMLDVRILLRTIPAVFGLRGR